jgi:2-octaprenyl-6-methoxyphenol hydroxylase
MHRDLIIVGGGPVGLTLALALADTDISVGVLEARAGEKAPLPQRTLALSHGSRLILERLGVWGRIEAIEPVSPIRAIDVSQRGGFGCTRLNADEVRLPALGYVTSYRALQLALERAARAADIAIEYGARVERIGVTPAYAHLEYAHAGGMQSLTARLVAVADGAGAALPRGTRRRHDYAQVAVIAEVRASAPPPGVAYERFTPEGPLALLPYGDGYTIVWTASPERATKLLALDPAEFLAALHAHFGDRVGAFTAVANRRSFPLALEFAWPRAHERVVAIGNAAQALHPVAGQGFNLGLRDAFELSVLLRDSDRDALGSREQLDDFARRRRVDRWSGIGFTHGLLAVFASAHPALAWPRGLALAALDATPGLKRFFTREMLYGQH